MSESMDNHDPVGNARAGRGDPDLERSRQGDHAAFARLYDRHAAVVMSICRTLLVPSAAKDEAEDACQETFLRAFRLLARLEAGGAFRPWVYAIARNVCAERRRAGARRTRLETAVTANGRVEHTSPRTGEERGIHCEQLDRLAAAMRRLPESERLALHLHHSDPDPVQAAREALGLSRSGFYKMLARAREQLAAMVGGDDAQRNRADEVVVPQGDLA